MLNFYRNNKYFYFKLKFTVLFFDTKNDFLTRKMDDLINLDFIEVPVTKVKSEKQQEKRFRSKIKGGYRPVLVNEDSLKNESTSIQPLVDRLVAKFNQNQLSAQDTTTIYILIYLQSRYSYKFLENFDPILSKNEFSIQSSIIFDQFSIDNNSNLRKRLKDTNTKSLFDLANNFNLHSIPKTARIALVKWYCEQYNLELIFHVARVDEIVDYQSCGKRCISLIITNLDKLVENSRDPLSFLLHDLVHSFKMFDNEELFKGQIGFSRVMKKVLNYNRLKDLFANDTNYYDDLYYIMSDMNSHTKHLMFSFKSCLINAFKRKYGIRENEQLRDKALNEFNQIFEELIELFGMNEEEKKSAREVLNVSDFKKFNFLLLSDYFIRLSNKNFDI
jgi:hypothetical protein